MQQLAQQISAEDETEGRLYETNHEEFNRFQLPLESKDIVRFHHSLNKKNILPLSLLNKHSPNWPTRPALQGAIKIVNKFKPAPNEETHYLNIGREICGRENEWRVWVDDLLCFYKRIQLFSFNCRRHYYSAWQTGPLLAYNAQQFLGPCKQLCLKLV